jgi:hypothetical protein
MFPQYVEGAATTVEVMRPAELLLGLLRNSFNLIAVGAPGIEALTTIARRTTGVRMTLGDLDRAVDLVRSTY